MDWPGFRRVLADRKVWRAVALAMLVCLTLLVSPTPSAVADHLEPADELLFYRDDGLFRFYDVRSDAVLGSPVLSGSGYTRGWSSITAVDLEGDGQVHFSLHDALPI